jgi:uncharacterized protein (TIRG00374 family)
LSTLRQPRVWIGIAVSALFLALFLHSVKWSEVGAALTQVDTALLIFAVAIEFGALWVRGLRWRIVLDSTVRISTNEATSLLLIGYAANNLLPMRAGDVVRAHLLHTKHGTSRLAGLGTVVVEKIFDGIVLAIFLAGAIALSGQGNAMVRLLAAAMGAAFAAMGVVIALLALWPAFATFMITLLGILPIAIRPKARAWLGAFLQGLSSLRGAGPWAAVVATTTVSWLLEAAMYALVGVAFHLDIPPAAYLAVCGAANLAIVVPSSAGGVGPWEFFARKVVVETFGVALAVGTAYVLVLHALLLVPVVISGLALLWRQHLGIGSMVQAGTAGAE